jgi:NADPH2:quinone reductase
MKSLQLQSCLHDSGTIECALFEVDIPEPGPDEVMIKVEAAPINPSDLGLMFGVLDTDAAVQGERNGHPSVSLAVPDAMMRAMSSRLNQWLPVGNEAGGTVVAAGSSDAAQALLGKRVGAFGGELFANYRVLPALQCLPLPDDVSTAEGASCFVNPMTALGFVETAKMEGHKAIIHAAAASNLGQMLNRICIEDGIPLINIVRSSQQVELLTKQGATYVLDSSQPSFAADLLEAIEATEATVAFDPIGGGTLSNQLLGAMEMAAQKRMTTWSRYGSDEHKQVYIYGMLDPSPTTLTRGYGFAWSVGGWLLFPFLQKRAGLERMIAMQQRVVAGLKTTFASHYSETVNLEAALSVDAVKGYGKKATGQKTLIVMGE